MMILNIFLLLSCMGCLAEKPRTQRAFSLFNMVQFKNDQCTVASDNDMKGVCMSEKDCEDNSGTADGNCAAGFGVCCMFVKSECGGSVDHNCTYIQNENYPSTTSTNQMCRYTFNRICDDLCQIRLDFDNLVLTQPTADTGSCSTTGDSAVAVSPTGASPPSNICGTLTGQHMYIETGSSGTAGTFTITTSIATGGRSWKIKVSYIECSSISKAPAGCVQYYTGESGTISSYNHQGGIQLSGQMYNLCMRQEEGFCSYQIRQNTATTPDPFQLLPITAAGINPASETNDCATGAVINYIIIPDSDHLASGNMRCGELLASVDADQAAGAVNANLAPGNFMIAYIVDETVTGQVVTGKTTASGFSLDYSQMPCTS